MFLRFNNILLGAIRSNELDDLNKIIPCADKTDRKGKDDKDSEAYIHAIV